MKKILTLSAKTALVLFFCTALIVGCKKDEKPAADALDKDTSYAFGMYMANFMASQMGLQDIHFDYSGFMEGFKAYIEASETRLTPDEAMEKINAAFMQMQAKNDEQMQIEGEKNQAEGLAYMGENGKRGGVVTTPSGLQYEVISQGNGAKPEANDMVRVNYEGTLIDGTIFDSSYQRGEPIEFNLSQVIPGWTEGVQLMNEGSTYRFVIPSELAYGRGAAGIIPTNSTLIFTVELLAVLK